MSPGAPAPMSAWPTDDELRGALDGVPGRTHGLGRAPEPPPHVPTEAEIDQAIIEGLTSRPRDAAPLYPEDSRTETPLARDQRIAASLGDIGIRRNEAEGSAYARERDRIEGETAARTQLENDRREAMGRATQRYRDAMDRAASLTIDPDGFYHSRGAAGTIASAIAVGLGALSSGINGGPNVALGMINDEINRDLEAQAQRIDSSFRRADAEGGLVQMMRDEFTDRQAALDAARSLALEDAAARVGEEASMLNSAEARVR